MLRLVLIDVTLGLSIIGIVMLARRGNSLTISPRTTRALPKPSMPWHELDQIMKNDHPERN